MTETVVRGLEGVVLTETRLSDIDGEAGRLTIGGFAVETLAPQATYEEAVHLLWHDALPAPAAGAALRETLAQRRDLAPATIEILRAAAARRVHPMDALRMATATLSLDDPAPADVSRAANLDRAVDLVARLPTIVAAFARLRAGQEPVAPDPALGHAANYLYMLHGTPPEPVATRALETYLNTVIDHGMNASTFTARVIVSTRSDITSAVVGAIGALKGPLHGGAPGPALDALFMLRERAAAAATPLADAADGWVRDCVATGERIMGFGHRVYKVRDPRADVLGAAAAALFASTGDAQLYEDAGIVETVVRRVLAELKPGRRLDTNVEFYTALVLHGLGLDSSLFSPTFAIGRVGGWTAHCLEQIAEDRLIRPRARYVGEHDRAWPTAPAA